MSHATSATPGGVVLDWRHGHDRPARRRACCATGRPLCRSPARDVPCHKGCAETWITTHAADAADRARLIRAYTPGGGAR